MKKLILAAAAMLVTGSMYGQGTVTFSTPSGVSVYLGSVASGVKVASTAGVVAGLYAGATGGSLSLVGATANVGVPVAGFVSGGTRTITGIAPGGAADVAMRAWSKAAGATYEAALATGNPAYLAGTSPTLSLAATGNPSAIPPGAAVSLAGLQSFAVTPVPEPSTIALGVLGGAALLLRRRK